MSDLLCEAVLEQGDGEEWTHAIDITPWLRKPLGWKKGDAAASTISTLTSITDTAGVLTLASKAIIATDTVPRDKPDTLILANHGVQFKASGGVAGKKYIIKVVFVDSDGNTPNLFAMLQIVGTPTA